MTTIAPLKLQDLIIQSQMRLAERMSRYFKNDEYIAWINEGCREVARRTETLISFNSTSIIVAAGVGVYTLPGDVIRLHRVEFVPTGSTQTIPVPLSTQQEMDNTWGLNQQSQSSWPMGAVIRGTPGMTGDLTPTIQLFPVPAQPGNLNLFYYRMPQTLVNPGDIVEIPVGWEDLILDYVEYRGWLRSRDSRYQDVKQIFEDKLQTLVDVSRQLHDQENFFINANRGAMPGYLFNMEDWW